MEGIERGSEENVRLVRSESRWVDSSEADSESNPWSLMDEDQREEHGSVRRRLVKKPKRVDSFDVEAMGIYDPYSHHRKLPVLQFESASHFFSQIPLWLQHKAIHCNQRTNYQLLVIPLQHKRNN